MYHTIEFGVEFLGDLEISPKHRLERLQIQKGTRLQAHIKPYVVDSEDGLVEVADLFVADGTATRLRGAYHAPDGSLLPVGGKTGTGDNRFDRFGAGGRLISQRVVDRTATFVFFLGDRFFGTITAYVPGAIAGNYHFTSAIAVQLLKAIEPQLDPLLRSRASDGTPQPSDERPDVTSPLPVAG